MATPNTPGSSSVNDDPYLLFIDFSVSFEVIMNFIRKLRIGAKLAIASGLGIVLVGAMLFIEIAGSSDVRVANLAAMRSLAVSVASAEAQSALRNMQIDIRDILLARTLPDLQRASGRFSDHQKMLSQLNVQISNLTKNAETRAQTETLAPLIARMAKGAEHIVVSEKDVIALEAKRSAGDATAEG